MTYDQVFLAVAFVVFLVTFVATMVLVGGGDTTRREWPGGTQGRR